jgi:hypothetical protein
VDPRLRVDQVLPVTGLLALLILAWFVLACWFVWVDVRAVCRAEDTLDELWGDE